MNPKDMMGYITPFEYFVSAIPFIILVLVSIFLYTRVDFTTGEIKSTQQCWKTGFNSCPQWCSLETKDIGQSPCPYKHR